MKTLQGVLKSHIKQTNKQKPYIGENTNSRENQFFKFKKH
jgi:hypothetical protein